MENDLVDFKWEVVLPASSKYGLKSVQPFAQAHFSTTSGSFSMNITPLGIKNILNEIEQIQKAIQFEE
jgi:hypothetical protein